ncbi:MAG: PQQ-like beta-propeller repeat protein [Verrucomicrobia bacterium]|nr:PQQ-like beta-propeller repeat protein [Verrucomicrobiota bacterium]
MWDQRWVGRRLPWAAGIAGAAAIGIWWFGPGSDSLMRERVPGTDRADAGLPGAQAAQWESGELTRGAGQPADLPGAWPGFRGAHLDGISRDAEPLAKSWPSAGPRVLWNIEVGEGFAGPAIWQGRVYLMDYDAKAQADTVRCLSLADGQDIWRYAYPVRVKRDHGMSRTIPAVTDSFLVTLGPKCHVHCLDPKSGAVRWRMSLVDEFNAEVPPWYAGQCPLVDGGRVILATGGDALLVAVDGGTGQVIWRSPNPLNWQMTHSSVMPIEFQGKRQYVYCASGGVAGIDAADGAILWHTTEWKITIANVPTPVPVGEGKLFLCGGYNAGSLMLELEPREGRIVPRTLFRLKASVFGATQQTPILWENHLYGVRPDGQLICLDLEGKPVWQSGPTQRFGSGPYLMAQGRLLLLSDQGVLTMAEAGPGGYRPLAGAKVLEGPDAWGPMALAGRRLIVRDLYRMACLDVGE